MNLVTRRIPTRLGELLVLLPDEGADLLLWPGVLFDHRLHLPLADALAARGIRTGFIEPPGFGGSTMSRHDFTMADCGGAFLDALDGLQIDRIAIGGTSWGGATSLHAALQEPDRIRGVVAMNAPFVGGSRKGLISLFPYAIRALPPGAVAAISPPNTIGRRALMQRSRAQIRALRESLQTASPRDRYAAATRVFRESEPVLDRLDQLEPPLLVIAGIEDRLCPLKLARKAADRAPNATLYVSETTGHLSAWEDPNESADVIAPFLNELIA